MALGPPRSDLRNSDICAAGNTAEASMPVGCEIPRGEEKVGVVDLVLGTFSILPDSARASSRVSDVFPGRSTTGVLG